MCINKHLYIYIYGLVHVTLGITLSYVTSLNISLLNVNFNKSTVGLNSILILFMLAKFQDNLRSIIMSLIMCLNLKFLHLKLCIKYGLLDQMVNHI